VDSDNQAALAKEHRGTPNGVVGHPEVTGQVAFGRQARARFEFSRLDTRLDPVGDPHVYALTELAEASFLFCRHVASSFITVLLIDPAQRQRLRDIRASLTARIAEAEREGWTGEEEGLKVSLAAAMLSRFTLDGRMRSGPRHRAFRRSRMGSAGQVAARNVSPRRHSQPVIVQLPEQRPSAFIEATSALTLPCR